MYDELDLYYGYLCIQICTIFQYFELLSQKLATHTYLNDFLVYQPHISSCGSGLDTTH
ncbi:hypothetical protein BDW60DRAFT_196183 [Aspergillus nidulans var. acristatus]